MVNRISIPRYRRNKNHRTAFFLLDVRPDHAFRRGHIAGAISIPLVEFGCKVNELDRNKTIVVYSQNSNDLMATHAALLLEDLGFPRVYILEGGFDGWRASKDHGRTDNVYPSREPTLSFKAMSLPMIPVKKEAEPPPEQTIPSDDIVDFLEDRTHIFEFDYLCYEVESVDSINSIHLMINPDPINLARVPAGGLVICHHKISTHPNRFYEAMLDQALENEFNIYNFHLGWDVMEGGIADSFLTHLGFSRDMYRKVNLTYRGHTIPNLGSILNPGISLNRIVNQLDSMNVFPSVIVNPQCQTSRVGYIPGGGFVDTMVIEMADFGADVLISSDHNFVVETIARELGMTLVEIDHYVSERYGLYSMQRILGTAFPDIPVTILENIESIQCTCEECSCNEMFAKNHTRACSTGTQGPSPAIKKASVTL